MQSYQQVIVNDDLTKKLHLSSPTDYIISTFTFLILIKKFNFKIIPL